VGPRAGVDTEVRGKILLFLPGIEPRSPGRPVRSQTLYCLSYPASTRRLDSLKSQRSHTCLTEFPLLKEKVKCIRTRVCPPLNV
jgi:hypothetical protein